MAAGYASGVLGALRALKPDLTAAQIVATAKSTVQPHFTLTNKTTTGGNLSPASAIASLAPDLALYDRSTNAGGSASARGDNGAAMSAAKAFDGDVNTKWLDLSANSWVQYEFAGGAAHVISGYSLTSGDDNDNHRRAPNNWTFKGSNDGTNWTNLDTRSNAGDQLNRNTIYYKFTNTTAYKYYRLADIQSNGDPIIQLGELHLLGPNPASTLTGSPAAAGNGTVNLTAMGVADWSHWGGATPNSTAPWWDRKPSVAARLISDYTMIGGGSAAAYATNTTGFVWSGSDGPNPSASQVEGSGTGVYVSGVGNGFTFSVTTDASPRAFKLYVGAWYAQARLEVRTLVGGTTVYDDSTVTDTAGSGNPLVYTLSLPANSAYTVRWTLTANAPGRTGNITLQAAALGNPETGSVSGSRAVSSGEVNLSSEGTGDWSHWGGTAAIPSATAWDHKDGLPSALIKNYTMVGGTPSTYATEATGFSWSGSAGPNASASQLPYQGTGVFVNHVGSGFTFDVETGATARTLKLYVGAWYARARLEVRSASGSTLYSDDGVNDTGGTGSPTVYTLALPSGGTYTIRWTVISVVAGQPGNITLQAATLSGASLGSRAASSGEVNLSAQGTADWSHWGGLAGSPSAPGWDRKSGSGTPSIGDYTATGGFSAGFSGAATWFLWTGSVGPNASASQAANQGTGVYGNGFQFNVATGTSARRLKVYVGAWHAAAQLRVLLNGATVYQDAGVSDPGGTGASTVYTLDLAAGSTYTIAWEKTGDAGGQSGNVTLQAATLA